MFELSVQTEFAAAHAIRIRGEAEHLHGHNWRVTVCVAGAELDGDGLLVDFHQVEGMLKGIVEPFVNRNLNEVPPFDRVNPTAEHVARYIGDVLGAGLGGLRDGGGAAVRVSCVRVSEAPGCEAVYRPPLTGPAGHADG